MENEKIFYNAVVTALDGNYKKIGRLFDSRGSWEDSFKSLGEDPSLPQKLWHQLEADGIALTLLNEPEYPANLKEIPLPPFGIYSLGRIPKNDELSLAIVGTRKTTPDGEDIAYELAKDLASKGINIVSGLAFGVDSAAHKGALTPATNRKLAGEILAGGGALISEYPPGSPALAHRFLERNRVVSGLSRGIIVVEAPERSGSLATARFATEQNREVFVVPGPSGHRNYKGSHALIREGARLVSSAEEILADLGLAKEQISLFEGAPEEKVILAIITNSSGVEFDEITETAKLDSALVGRILNSLLLAGKIEETSSGYKII